jgi:hypothetical protein
MSSLPYFPPVFACTLLLGVAACGDDGMTTVGASAGSTTSITGVDPTSGGSGSGSATVPTSDGDGTVSDSGTTVASLDTTATGPGPSTGPGTETGPVTESTSASSGGSSGSSGAIDDTGSSTGGMKLDIGGDNCEIKCGNSDWSYVWIANSGEHTLSKIDTRNLTEEGRYITRADQQGNPSRTSVSIDGKAVAVANRSGGITKVWARKEYCTDKNGNGMIETSTGKNNVLPFAQEECIAWYTAFDGASTQRPVAWTSGVYNNETCEYDDQKIWTAASYGDQVGSCAGTDGIYVYRLNGDTGVVEDTVHLPNIPCGLLGAYGAAVDVDNNVWFFVFGGGVIFRVDYVTLQTTVVNKGFYGITVDTKSRVWLDDGSRYDPMTNTWANQIGDLPPNGGSGVAQDLQGRIWHATQGGIGWLDSETMVVGGKVLLPNQNLARGIGVDVDGYIWAVPLGSTAAYRIHPDTFEIASYDGLNQPYTYSDMAGGQINNVICPQ